MSEDERPASVSAPATATPAALTSYAVMTWVPGAFLVGLVEPTAMLMGAIVGFAAFIPLVVTGVNNLKLGDLEGRHLGYLFVDISGDYAFFVDIVDIQFHPGRRGSKKVIGRGLSAAGDSIGK